jgi:hypothetical protein
MQVAGGFMRSEPLTGTGSRTPSMSLSTFFTELTYKHQNRSNNPSIQTIREQLQQPQSDLHKDGAGHRGCNRNGTQDRAAHACREEEQPCT